MVVQVAAEIIGQLFGTVVRNEGVLQKRDVAVGLYRYQFSSQPFVKQGPGADIFGDALDQSFETDVAGFGRAGQAQRITSIVRVVGRAEPETDDLGGQGRFWRQSEFVLGRAPSRYGGRR